MSDLHTWEQPVCGKGDSVIARMHQGPVGAAKVHMVSTHYDADRAAYHSYWVCFAGHQRHQWLSKDAILSVGGDHDA